jgi:hypothetical protein
MSAQNNLTIDKGTDFIYNIHLIDSSGVPVDISGFTGSSQLRTSYSSNVHMSLNVFVSTVNTGLITLSMNSAIASTLTASRYLYDLTLTSSNNVVSRLMEGYITVNPSVTR